MAKSLARSYKSPLREARAAETRQKIVAAFFEVARGGVAELTMPAVAKAAGVSLPTVYRYFPDKGALVDAAAEEARRRLGVRTDPAPDLACFVGRVREVWSRTRDASELVGVLVAATMQGPHPVEAQAERRKGIAATLRSELRGIQGRDRQMLIDWVMMLGSSSVAAALSRFNFVGDDGSDRIIWAIETLLLGVRARQRARAEGKSDD